MLNSGFMQCQQVFTCTNHQSTSLHMHKSPVNKSLHAQITSWKLYICTDHHLTSILYRIAVSGNGGADAQRAGAAVLQLVHVPLPLAAVIHQLYLTRRELHEALRPFSWLHDTAGVCKHGATSTGSSDRKSIETIATPTSLEHFGYCC